jgi:glycosyltransferase involved in cell wall biosynthesis
MTDIRKVILATMSLGIGGAETHIVELALELKRRGVDVSVASSGGVYVAELEAAGIAHHEVPMHRRSIAAMLRSLVLMRRLVKREKPDVVHAHARIPGFVCGLVRKAMRKKDRFAFVTTAHFDFKVGRGLRYLTNWGQKTVAVSEDMREYLVKNYDIKPDDIIVSVNGINTDK